MLRPFLRNLGFVIGAILLGLASRRFRSDLPWFIGEYAGDTLWAGMVYFLAATIWPNARTGRLAVGALAFSWAIEASQLYQAPWINSVRATTLGGLVLGFGFLWSDLICYTAGVALAVGIDLVLRRK
jgi:hypothetical protein